MDHITYPSREQQWQRYMTLSNVHYSDARYIRDVILPASRNRRRDWIDQYKSDMRLGREMWLKATTLRVIIIKYTEKTK